MKRLSVLSSFILSVVLFFGCKENNLEEFTNIQNSPVSVIAGGSGDGVVKTNDFVQIPMLVKLSQPATSTFDVELSVNNDTIQSLINNGTLKDTKALPSAAYSFPNVVKFKYGTDTASFVMTISRTEIEKVFGSKFSFAYQLVNPGKGNNLGNPHTSIVTLNTLDLLTLSDIHYISMTPGRGGIVLASRQQNYDATTVGITVPLGLLLGSFPGRAFNVEVATTGDSIPNLIAAGKIPANTTALKTGDYTITTRVQVPSNKSSQKFELSIPWTKITPNRGNYLAINVYFKNPSLHVLNLKEDYCTILIDCSGVLETDVTSQGVLTVNRDNNAGPTGGEGSLKVVDNNYSSKFLQQNYNGDLAMTLTFSSLTGVGAYTLTSGNDAKERDPKDWTMEGSVDGVTWVKIDERTNENFDTRLLTRRFNIQRPGKYKYYRFNVLNNIGSSIFQLTEWRMISFD